MMIKWFGEDIEENEKLNYLSILYKRGFLIPKGFLVIKDGENLSEIKKAYEELAFGKIEGINKKALEIIRVGREMPFVYVGDLENNFRIVKGADNVLESVKEINSNYIIVQKFLDAEKTGEVYFNGKYVIKAHPGYNQSEGDEYILNENLEIVEKKIGNKTFKTIFDKRLGRFVDLELTENQRKSQILNEDEILSIAKLLKRVRDLIGDFVLEWIISQGRLYIWRIKDKKIVKEEEIKIIGEKSPIIFANEPGDYGEQIVIFEYSDEVESLIQETNAKEIWIKINSPASLFKIDKLKVDGIYVEIEQLRNIFGDSIKEVIKEIFERGKGKRIVFKIDEDREIIKLLIREGADFAIKDESVVNLINQMERKYIIEKLKELEERIRKLESKVFL